MRHRVLTCCALLIVTFMNLTSTSAHMTDIGTNPYREAIEYAAGKGYMAGYNDHSFRPLANVNRAELVKILVSVKFTQDEIRKCSNPAMKLSDVVPGDWYVPTLCVAFTKGFVKGYPDGTFRASEKVTVAEAGKMMLQILGYGVTDNPEEWYRPYLEKLERLRALPKTLTYVTAPLTRADVAEMIYRILEGKTGSYSISINRLIINQRLHDEGKM